LDGNNHLSAATTFVGWQQSFISGNNLCWMATTIYQRQQPLLDGNIHSMAVSLNNFQQSAATEAA